ncbi:hypothetical protein E5D57_005562 [Metarhizium anisopliae]|nr:hypothetical protein E5D57_005562 [Metarhizium anisopliae]
MKRPQANGVVGDELATTQPRQSGTAFLLPVGASRAVAVAGPRDVLALTSIPSIRSQGSGATWAERITVLPLPLPLPLRSLNETADVDAAPRPGAP